MPSTHSTASDLRDFFIRMAEESKTRATHRKETVTEETRIDLTNKFGFRKIKDLGTAAFEIHVTTTVGSFLAKDPVFKAHVADNQWYIQQAIMHGNAATEIAVRDLIEVISNGQRA